MRSDDEVPVARRVWRLLEPYHGITYFASEAREEFNRAGLPVKMMYYLAGRTAAMGPVSAGPAAAALYNFHPKLVGQFLPRAWSHASPKAVLDARLTGVDRALRRVGVLDDARQESALRQAAELTRAALENAEPRGRPLFAAHAELPWPTEPHLALWHGATLVREHRGDGHATALLYEEVNGCEAHMIVVASGRVGRDWLRFRGWTEKDCTIAEESLRSRGWIDDQGQLTSIGWDAHQRIERNTDRLAAPFWRSFGDERTELLAKLLQEIVTIVDRSGVLPEPYPPVG